MKIPCPHSAASIEELSLLIHQTFQFLSRFCIIIGVSLCLLHDFFFLCFWIFFCRCSMISCLVAVKAPCRRVVMFVALSIKLVGVSKILKSVAFLGNMQAVRKHQVNPPCGFQYHSLDMARLREND